MRIGLFLILLGALLGTGVQAQQSIGLGGGQGSVNKLTAKQIADGWIQLFDGATDYGWKPRAEGKWTVVDGALVSPVGQPSAISTTTEFGEGELHIECARGGAVVPSIELHVIDGDAPGLITSIGFPLRHPADRIKDRTNVWTSYDFVENGKIFETRVNGKPKTAFEMHSTRRG
ncbi:MAG: hypothetical protein JWN14_5164, partial [Chthonomonadales bacterium]|nr:hypothetical protein [Chthonomonadales bacterium]